MKTIYDNYNDEVTLHDVCYLIYQGYGTSIVRQFADVLRQDGEAITDHQCVPCEDDTPHYDNVCLICGTGRDDE